MAKVKLNGADDNTLAALEKQYQPSDNVKALGSEVSANYSALKSAGSANYAAANKALDKWKNYGDFTYNPDTDVLFQNAKANAIANGKVAMEDTIGQASALTGGYANSFAASAGSQAYQNYLKTLDDDLANYYQIALDNYERGKNDLLTEYSLENERGQQAWDRAYGMYGIADSRYQNERGFDYGKYSDDYNRAMSLAGMENSDYWKQTEFDEGVRQYDNTDEYRRSVGSSGTGSSGTSGGGKSSSYDIDGWLASWSNKKNEGDTDTIAREAASLYMNGNIDSNFLLAIGEKYLGLADADLDNYEKLKEIFGPSTAKELQKEDEEK